MITEQEVYGLKKQLLLELTEHYQNLLKAGKLDAKRADAILKHVKERLAPVERPSNLKAAFVDFCETYPEFKSILKKYQNKEREILQKIAQECSDNLMESDTEKWESLSDQIETLKPENIAEWIKQLPQEQYKAIMKALLTPVK